MPLTRAPPVSAAILVGHLALRWRGPGRWCADRRRRRDWCRVSSATSSPLLQDGDAIGAGLDLGQGMAGDQDRCAICREGVDDGVEVVARHGIEAAGGLVEKSQFGFADQHLREAQALAHSFGIGFDAAVGGILQPDAGRGDRQSGCVRSPAKAANMVSTSRPVSAFGKATASGR